MNDLFHYFGGDLSASPTGDLRPVSGSERGKQRILRRLMTNPREVLPDGTVLPPDYIAHPDYGAGLPRYVGQVFDPRKVSARIRGQMMLEDVVAKTPAPVITVQPITGGMTVTIQYVDAKAKTQQTLSFNVSK